MSKRRFVCIGKVTKVHGIKGEVKIYPFSQSPESMCAYEKLCLAPEGQELSVTAAQTGWHDVERCRPQGKYAIVALKGVADRNGAESLLGYQVHVAQSSLAPLQENEFYWHDLEGMAVISDSGQELGTITGLFSTGAYDMLVVKGEGGEVMIPAVKEFITAIDPEANRVTVYLVPGLLEINS